MMVSTTREFSKETGSIVDLYKSVRARTIEIVSPLEIEDYVIQTADFMSPPRWHIGHTSWFFETLLQAHQPGYKVYSDDYLFYFNSYYEGFGARIERPKRGTKSRPTVRATVAYRNHVDDEMQRFLESVDNHPDGETVLALVRLGLEHEMQHQELLVYDIKHLLCDQFDVAMQPAPPSTMKVEGMAEIEGGLIWLGYESRPNVKGRSHSSSSLGPQASRLPRAPCSPSGAGGTPAVPVKSLSDDFQSLASANYDFAFDNEKPAHQFYLQDFAIDKAPISNGEFLEFMRDGGYQNFRWWFSEGWEVVNRDGWRAPLYWELHDGQWMIRDFAGLHTAESQADYPVSHVSFYEASAFAKWVGKRLPTEAEWERAACYDSRRSTVNAFPWGDYSPDIVQANLFENGLWSVAPIGAFPEGENAYGCQQMIGDVWEWTTSDYVPYPGFKSEFDEYNDKWFVNQKVLRGGSFATPQIHIRSTYRNFFHAHERWMVSGFRCASDLKLTRKAQ